MSQINFPIFNPRNFQEPTVLNALIASSIQSTNMEVTKFGVVNEITGIVEDGATKNYVDQKINTLLGTDIPDQLNQNLDSIIEIGGAINNLTTLTNNNSTNITNLTSVVNTKANQSSLDTTNTNLSDLETVVNTKANQSSLDTTNTNLTNLTTVVNTKANQSSLDTTNTNLTNLTTVVNTKANQSSLDTTNTNLSNLSSTVSGIQTDITDIENDILSLDTNKLDKSNQLTNNTHYINSGTNQIYNKVQNISSSGQCLMLSAGGFTENNNIVFNRDNYTVIGPDSAFASPSVVITNTQNILIENCTRLRMSNIQLGNMVVNNSLGRHTFKGVVFNQNFTLTGTNSNWINFYYCSFSGQVNINNTFGGYCIFYFCDFQGATLNFNNALPQQIYINSCVNLPSLTGLNALLNGFNSSIGSSSINSVSLNVSGSLALPNNSITINNINGLDTRLTNNETNITNIQNSISNIDNTSDLNKPLSTAQQTYIDNAISNLLGGTPQSSLDTIVELGTQLNNNADAITAINASLASKAGLANNNTFTGSNNFTGGLSLNGNSLNTTLTNINTSLTNLDNNKQDNLLFDNTPVENSTNLLNSGSIFSTLSNYVLSSSLISTLANYTTETDLNNALSDYVLNSSLTSTLSNYVLSSSLTSTLSNYALNSSLSNYVLSSSLTSTLSNYALNSSLSNYVLSSSLSTTLSDYALNSSLSNYVLSSSLSTTLSSYALNTNSIININKASENLENSGSGGNLSLNYSTCDNVIFYTPNANFTLTITNVPTTNFSSYTLTFVFNAKFYINAININGTNRTILFNGGASAVSIDNNASLVLQNITILYSNTSTPFVISNVSSLFN